MDILSTKNWSSESITKAIEDVESRYPSIKLQNIKIREFVATHPGVEKEIDVDAALISDCRSDYMTCGRCQFIAKYGDTK